MVDAYCDGGGNNQTKADFYCSFSVDGSEDIYRFFDLEVKSTNQAEYVALIKLLEHLVKNKISDVLIHSDSKLVVNQVTGIWRVESPEIRPLHIKAVALLAVLTNVKLEWVSRKVIVKQLGH